MAQIVANQKKVESDNPKVVDKNGRPDYGPPVDLQPRLDEKREALDAKLAQMNEQDDAARAAHPPAPGVTVK